MIVMTGFRRSAAAYAHLRRAPSRAERARLSAAERVMKFGYFPSVAGQSLRVRTPRRPLVGAIAALFGVIVACGGDPNGPPLIGGPPDGAASSTDLPCSPKGPPPGANLSNIDFVTPQRRFVTRVDRAHGMIVSRGPIVSQ